MTVDFSDLNRTNMILPTGQSGLHNSPHCSDQAHLYHEGKYRVTYFDKDHITNSPDFEHLRLIPK